MIQRKATQIGNPIIRSSSRKVKDISSRKIKRIIQNLIDSMRFHELVGMAAPQIDLNIRIFVTEIRATKTRRKQKNADPLRVYINPSIVSYSKKHTLGYEGCGSVASGQLFGPVRRPEKVVVRAKDEKGRVFILEAKDLLARVIQHELDHLDGLVFIDKVADTKKLLDRSEYIKKFR
ncbi:MAG: peptide deformylase [Candidatus Wildermuthbacteria bacterium RIFCSPHIGHO2_02_FULL_47_12]|uniref:Peptide deformylase n=1 Tax=Candidatus Wildermuthbacteria bacterium RIFCSPHIGHO2_02_FULL_47_12 TaxID=1802451 RepID=A0A1G2R147_9BACT|nr:MAG: peptide deformylase [Candidatus Wildermuthbacteria bacterium RIFCSPHIGHO2_02_FULL_47_12]